ncbi:MAG: LTA synthase family protein [Lachnospiraceae bacterium]|nr:LTA synthase family protein [Lachnospiraceae bacterium]
MKVTTAKNKKAKIEKVNRQKVYIEIAVGIIALLLVPVLAFLLLEWYGHNPFEEVREKAMWFNIFLFELIAWILFFVTGRARLALRLELVAAMVFGLANTYVVKFRTNPIVPWDFMSIRTAASVASNYDLTPDKRMLLVSGLFLLLIAVLQFVKLRLPMLALKKETFDWKENGKKLALRLLPAGLSMLVLTGFVGKLQDENFQTRNYLYPFLFTPVYMTDVNGIAVTFAMNLAYMSIDEPEGYDREEVQAILAEYESTEKESRMPNIIVVMNEAFSDMASVAEFTASEDYMPFMHSLQQGAENTITGNLQVSVCGGNTANSEFEFLTGNSMAFLPQGSIPYQQYLIEEIPSIPLHLKEMGYYTVAAHPYHASGWERNTIYPMLGFERSIFINEYDRGNKLRTYISDAECVDKIIQIYEEKVDGTPLFMFNVTMQNHGGYTDEYANFTPDITVEGLNSLPVEQYLSLMKVSDAEFARLVDYFSQVEEDTMIVFFGDHQPNDAVAGPLVKLNGGNVKNFTNEELLTRYEVPYAIWANFDIEEETGANTSLNYLGVEMFEAAGMKNYTYQNFLQELEETYPVISAMQVQRADGTVSNIAAEEEGLRLYQSIQYYYLFDNEE